MKMMEGSYKNLFSIQIRVFKIVAQWPFDITGYLPSHLQFVQSFLWKSFRVFSVILASHMTILHFKTSYDALEDGLDAFAEMSTVSLVYVFCMFNTIYFQTRHKLLRETIDFADSTFRRRSAKGLTYVTIEKSYLRSSRFSLYWILICVGSTIFWCLYPLTLSGKNLPLKCWYPFDEKQPYVFEAMYFIQFLAQVQLGIGFPTASMFYVAVITLICGQYDILFCSLKNFIYTAELKTRGAATRIRLLQGEHDFSNEEVNQYYCEEEKYEILNEIRPRKYESTWFEEENMRKSLNDALKDCAKHHQNILNACNKIEQFFSPICFVKQMQIMFQLCFMVFFVVNANATWFRLISIGQYLSLTFIELTLVTYYGETLQRHSACVADALARSDWYQVSRLVKRDILIVLIRNVKPVKLTAGKFSTMDIEKWKSVLKTAFSFFTLLQNLK